MKNSLKRTRLRRGWAVADLAAQAGVSRQAIHAIEKGDYVPNTTIALKLARLLEVTVEELFELEERSDPRAPQQQVAELLAEAGELQPGQPVRLCQVGSRTVAAPAAPVPFELPASDAMYAGPYVGPEAGGGLAGAWVRPLHAGDEPSKRLLIAGCDPAVSLLDRYIARQTGFAVMAVNAPSRRALEILRAGQAHIAGTHLREEAGSNLAVILRYLPQSDVRVVTFAAWEQGFVVARSNPKGIRGFADLARPELVLVNREPGSGSRTVLDSQLKALGLDGEDVQGYRNLASGHLEGASKVRAGQGDFCLAVRPAATVFGLDFIPLVSERYDLVIPKTFLSFPPVASLLELLERSEFRYELEALGGYDTGVSGRQVS